MEGVGGDRRRSGGGEGVEWGGGSEGKGRFSCPYIYIYTGVRCGAMKRPDFVALFWLLGGGTLPSAKGRVFSFVRLNVPEKVRVRASRTWYAVLSAKEKKAAV